MQSLSTISKIVFLLFMTVQCQTKDDGHQREQEQYLPNYFTLNGNAQGTSYTITYCDSLKRDFSVQIDSILRDYDQHLSTYIDTSLISLFNTTIGSGIRSGVTTFDYDFIRCERGEQSVFEQCFSLTREVYELTEGAFNPTVFPLVKFWGFFKDETLLHDQTSMNVDSVLSLVDFRSESVFLRYDTIRKGQETVGCYPLIIKTNGNIQLDFNGVAQGHSVDVIAAYFFSQGIINYMIELGGEVRTSGVSYKNQAWRLGIDKPIDGSVPSDENFQVIVALQGQSLATSGNYRKFYEIDGVKYSHTINPFTGYPVQHSLISVSVIAPTCAEADAYATAFMVMGTEKSLAFIEAHAELELNAYFVNNEGGEWQVKQSAGFDNYIIE
jgi:FAD:protein FMN transferase